MIMLSKTLQEAWQNILAFNLPMCRYFLYLKYNVKWQNKMVFPFYLLLNVIIWWRRPSEDDFLIGLFCKSYEISPMIFKNEINVMDSGPWRCVTRHWESFRLFWYFEWIEFTKKYNTSKKITNMYIRIHVNEFWWYEWFMIFFLKYNFHEVWMIMWKALDFYELAV